MTSTNTTETTKPRTLAQLAQEAFDVQDACNLTGVLHSFAQAVGELRELTEGYSWEAVDHHPITLMWADKVASLTGLQQSSADDVAAAYKKCRELAKEVE